MRARRSLDKPPPTIVRSLNRIFEMIVFHAAAALAKFARPSRFRAPGHACGSSLCCHLAKSRSEARVDKLARQSIRSLVLFVIFCGALLFLPAGTLRYWQGWLFLAVL